MPALRLVHLLPLVFVAIVALFHRPVNALVADRAQVARHVHAHDGLARRKRSAATCNPTSTSPSLPASSSSSAPASTTTAPSSTKKWGLAWGDDLKYLENFAYLPKVQYIYNWVCTIDVDVTKYGLDYMSMYWGWDKTCPNPNPVRLLAGPNEPDIPTQANMAVEEAYTFFSQYLEPNAGPNHYILSPCLTGRGGVEWMSQFMGLCTTCQIDCMCMHGYSNNSQDIISFAQAMHDTFNKPVCITEFAAQDFSGQSQPLEEDVVLEFAYNMTAFIDSTDWIEMAMPFGIVKDLNADDIRVNPLNALRDYTGNPTRLANVYFG